MQDSNLNLQNLINNRRCFFGKIFLFPQLPFSFPKIDLVFSVIQCAESFIFLAYKETLLVEFHVCEIRITCNFRSIVFFFFFRNKKLKAVMHFAGELFSFVIKNLIYFLYVLQHAIRVTGLCGGGVHILGNSCAESSS